MRALLLSALLLSACASKASHDPSSPVAATVAAPERARATTHPRAGSSGPKKTKLTVAEARRHMVELVNRDRATQGLAPVSLEEGPAQRAGQRHAEDMAKHGFLGHWGTDGSVPEQRYTESGGSDFVMENASCITDEKTRELDPSPTIEIEAIEHAESMFFNETPPNDGHRKNILKRQHRKVGIGIALAKATPTEIPGLCLTQEFIDPY
jgi:uncharacterized protein YkwD